MTLELTDLLKAIVLGIVEGITEFLPISSTGHLIVAATLLQFDPSLMDTFVIFIQLGAVVAVVVYYGSDLLRQVRTVRTDSAVQRLWLAVVIATVPAALVGFALRGFIREVLFHPVPIAIALIVGGIVLIVIERRPAPSHTDNAATLPPVTLRQALWIGIAQTLALVPGVSRSAASIVGGMIVGLSRAQATAFSFYLAITTLGGATLADFVFSLDEINGDDLVLLLTGALTAAIVAWLSIRWLLRYVASHTFTAFGYYRIAAGAVVLSLFAVGVL